MKPPSIWLTLGISLAAFGIALAAFSIALVLLMGVHSGKY